MHTIQELGTNVPAFLAKLWRLVEDPKNKDLICWSPTGKSFFIRNQAKFASELLPYYYKHNNMPSFVRQLNMYGFHKIVSVELGGLKCDKDEMEFAHQYFIRGNPGLLEHIKRKIASSKTQDAAHSGIKPELMNKMLTEVRNMKGRQEDLDSRIGAIKNENEAMWRELAMLRQKHIKQQQIVNKLIHFFVSMCQSSRSSGLHPVKRQYPRLMIDDLKHKERKLSKAQTSPTGPVIHELDSSEPDLDSEYIVDEMLENENPAVHSLQEHVVSSIDDSMDTVHLPDTSVQLENDIQIKHRSSTMKKHSKDKKKRKNKVPIKILIPPLGNGGKPREELHMLNIPTVPREKTMTTVLKKDSVGSKTVVPMATVRSSKLAAMAANMNTTQEFDTDTSADVEDDGTEAGDDVSIVKLEEFLNEPDMVTRDNVKNQIKNGENSNSTLNKMNKGFNQTDSKNVFMADNYVQNSENKASKCSQQWGQSRQKAGTSSSKDLSLSCVNSSGMSEANYRLEPTEEMDSHVELIQHDLDNVRDNLREVLRENCNFDVNAICELFGDDSLAFGLPVNPELNPHCDKDDYDTLSDGNGSAGGELMTYNPSTGLLEAFDDMIDVNTSSSWVPLSPPTTSDLSANDLHTQLSTPNLYTDPSDDPLSIEDNKISLLDSLVKTNMNPSS